MRATSSPGGGRRRHFGVDDDNSFWFPIFTSGCASTVRESRTVQSPSHATQSHGYQLNAPSTQASERLRWRARDPLGCPCSIVRLWNAVCPSFRRRTRSPPFFWNPPICPNSRGGPVSHRGVPTGPCSRLLAFVRRYPCRPISVWAFPQWPCLWLGKPVGQNPHAPTFPAHSFHPYPHIRVEFCLAGTYTFV